MSEDKSWIINHMLNRDIIDEIDAEILDQLLTNCRQKTTDIASKVSASRPTVYERINKLEERGIISSYTSELNLRLCGLPLTAYILVGYDTTKEVEGASQKTIALAISRLEFVQSVNIITGPQDFLVKVAIDDMGSLADVIIERIRQIKGVGNTITMTSFAEYRNGKRIDRQ